MSSEVRQALIDARALIADPDHWIKGTFAATAENAAAMPRWIEAVKFCSVGALRRATDDRDSTVVYACQALRRALTGGERWASVTSFNDADETSHADVLALFDRAIQATP